MEPIRLESHDHLYDGDYCDSAYYQHILDQAALLLARGEPDRAALILDGVAQRMVMSWFVESGARVPEPSYLLPRLEEKMSPLVWWLRLALRAPDVDARLVHCRRLLDEIAVGRAL